MGGVFINYRGVDSGTAAALIDRELSSSLGSDRVFLDSRSIPIGADFAGELLGRLRTCTVLLVVIGPRWLSVTGKSGMRRIDEAEDWIRLEVAEALRHGLRVVPVLTDQATLPRSDELPPDIAELSRRQYVRLRNRYTAVDLAELVRRIFEADPALGCGHPILPGDETRHQPLAAPNLPASRIGPAAVADTVVPPHAVEGEIHLRLSRAHVVPRQLPAEPTRFAGRNQELTMLTAALDGAPAIRATVPISAIGGAGGIGKTWLALRWAHRHLDWFPDGQLFVDLGGFAPAGPPMPPAVAVRGFLDALGVDPLAIPIDPDAQVGLYRSLVANRRMLIVLDNARDTAQIAPLLPGTATCMVLVTSRRHLAGLITNHGAEALTLDVLPEADARQLLATHLGPDHIVAEADAITALLAYCAGLPLALSIVAARARHHPDFPLSLLAEELQDRATRLPAFDAGEISASLRTVFSASYDALTNDAAALFELLGLAPGPDISMAAAASLMGLPLARVQPLLRELEIAHLLTQPVPGRYRMHDLLHLYAAGQICQKRPADFVEDALRRLVDYYLNTSRSAGWLIDPFFSPALELAPPVHGCLPHSLADRAAALAWFDAEYACLLAILRQVSARGWNRAAWQLAMLIDIYFRRRGYLHDRLTTWQACLAAANQDADPAGVIHGHCTLGDLSA